MINEFSARKHCISQILSNYFRTYKLKFFYTIFVDFIDPKALYTIFVDFIVPKVFLTMVVDFIVPEVFYTIFVDFIVPKAFYTIFFYFILPKVSYNKYSIDYEFIHDNIVQMFIDKPKLKPHMFRDTVII